MSLLSHLECSVCGREHDAGRPQGLATCHPRPLLARYDLDAARERVHGTDASGLFGTERSLWRYSPLLPAAGPLGPVTLGEGWTPLLPGGRLFEPLGMSALVCKDEGQNPTGSFKARGMAAAISRARALGVTHVSVPTAGNAGGAAAAYAAAAGMRATVAMPRDAPEANKAEVRAAGAELVELDGLITDCGAWLKARAAETGAFDLSTLKEPYRLEGKKTMGYELWEQGDGVLPEVIVYPTGGGTGLIGMWKAFAELESLGLIGTARPRMVSVQSEGCAPIVRAFEAGAEEATPWDAPATIAGGLRVPAAVGDRLILDALRASGGTAVAVPEDGIRADMRLVASRAGLLVSPEAAATVTGLRALVDDGAVDRTERVALFLTGSGLKHLDLF